jgi:NADH-quinone oxidoreductase subunit N
MTIKITDLLLMMPELLVLVLALLLLVVDLMMPQTLSRRILAWASLLGLAAVFVVVLIQLGQPSASFLEDSYRSDQFAKAVKLVLLGASFLLILGSSSYMGPLKKEGHGEFYYLFLFALCGGMFMASSADLITLYVGLEVLSLSSYVLAGLRKQHIKSNEAAFKYLILGGTASAVFLFGASYAYGLTGTTHLMTMGQRLGEAMQDGMTFFVVLAFVMMLGGLGFKVSLAPFHMWAPDVYEGAHTPVTTFLSIVSKTAAFALMYRILVSIFILYMTSEMVLALGTVLAVVAGFSMIVGNTAAMRQTNVKRMMAYSSVAHASYLLVPLASLNQLMYDQLFFYVAAYLFMTIGIFVGIMIVEDNSGSEALRAFAGLYHRSPLLAAAITILLMSTAGFPLTAGFIGKFYILLGAVGTGAYWLAGIMILTSVMSYYYYFGVVRQMYLRPGETEGKLNIPVSAAAAILISVAGTLVLGIWPNLLMNVIQNHFQFLTDMFQPLS